MAAMLQHPSLISNKEKERNKEEEKKKEEEGSSAIRLWRWGRGLFDTRLLIATHDSSSYYYQLCPSDVDVVRRVWRGKQNKPPLSPPRSSLTREPAQGLDDPAKDNRLLNGATKENGQKVKGVLG
ncbi:hypothetical protein JMJ77_0002175 [Colletotrichum scovillei]|uniref:Uncharacterized protein n=1 Tax=Colletotrichum scovillei TaxID=1209932 RepID=A0A9P7UGB9_9PEZI|nr:hypothetical protein JMJ77_0002175 [Colletotrichum scovillei]KAG7078843.1 hypothetical protein JMJ78_0002506 [Colletotrichum scovillei]